MQTQRKLRALGGFSALQPRATQKETDPSFERQPGGDEDTMTFLTPPPQTPPPRCPASAWRLQRRGQTLTPICLGFSSPRAYLLGR